MLDYVVVIVLSAIISELLGLNLREELSQTMRPCSQVMGKSLVFFSYRALFETQWTHYTFPLSLFTLYGLLTDLLINLKCS